jgi:hypothetical protein
MFIAPTHWNVPHLFRGAQIMRQATQWEDAQPLASIFKEKRFSFRLGKRQATFFGDCYQLASI